MQELLDIAISAAEQASEKIIEVYHTDFSKTVQTKSDNSPLTIADIAANEIITNLLRKTGMPILSEEGALDAPRDTPYCWIVDPLDGTKGFINKSDEFVVSIALVKDGRPVIGVLAVPVKGTIFFASKGKGAFKQESNKRTRIHVSDRISELVWIGSKLHPHPEEEKLREKNSHLIKTVISVSSALKGTMMAEGIADVYYRFGLTSEWDVCAMHCIVEEAGGIFRELDGGEKLYNRSASPTGSASRTGGASRTGRANNHLNEKGFYIVNRAENIWV